MVKRSGQICSESLRLLSGKPNLLRESPRTLKSTLHLKPSKAMIRDSFRSISCLMSRFVPTFSQTVADCKFSVVEGSDRESTIREPAVPARQLLAAHSTPSRVLSRELIRNCRSLRCNPLLRSAMTDREHRSYDRV